MPAGRKRSRSRVRSQSAQIATSERMNANHNGTSRCLWGFPSSELKLANGKTMPMTYDPFASRGQRVPPRSYTITLSQLVTQAASYLQRHGKLPWLPAPNVQRNDATWSQGHKNKFIDSLFHGQASQTCFVIHKNNANEDCQGEILDAGHRYRTIMEFVGLHPDTGPFLWKPEPDASSKISLSPEEQLAVSYADLPDGTRMTLENTTFPVTCYYGLSVQEKSNLFSRMQIQIPLTNGEALSSMSAYKPTLNYIKQIFDEGHVQELFKRFREIKEDSTDLMQMKHYPYFTAIGYNFFVHAFGEDGVSVMDRADPDNKEFQFKKANGFCAQKADMNKLADSDAHKAFFALEPNPDHVDGFNEHVWDIIDVLEGAKNILPKELFQVSLALLQGTDSHEVRVRFLELRRQSQQFNEWKTGLHDVNKYKKNKTTKGDDIWNSPASKEYRKKNDEPHWDEKDLEFDRAKCINNGLKLDKKTVWNRLDIFLNPSERTLELRRTTPIRRRLAMSAR